MLQRNQIEAAFNSLNAILAHRGERAEICLVGGAVMCLVHHARPSTKDVDAWFAPGSVVRSAAEQVASELNLPSDWLNDGAKAYIPANAGKETWLELSHLSLSHVDAKTLLAMKCLAARGQEDASDIVFLARLLGLTSAQLVLDLVERYFPRQMIPMRTQLLLDELLS